MRLRWLLPIFWAALFSAHTFASDTIYWQTYHIPPISIKMGDDKGTGFLDKMLALITARLPQYQHEHPLTSHSRALDDLRKGKPVCHQGLFVTPERQQYAVFSIPSLITPNMRIITKKGSKLIVDSHQPTDLLQISRAKDFVFGLIKGRSYSPALDKKISLIEPQRILALSVEDADSILKMVHLERLDMTLAYPFEIGYFNAKRNEQQLVSHLVDGVSPYAVGNIACPNNVWGRQVIAHINKMLPELRRHSDYLDAMTHWWQSERETESFQVILDEVFPIARMQTNTVTYKPKR